MTADAGHALLQALRSATAPLLDVASPAGVRGLLAASGWVEFSGVDVDTVAAELTALADGLRDALEDPPSDIVEIAELIQRLAGPAATVAHLLSAPDAPADIAGDLADALREAWLARCDPALPVLTLLGAIEMVDLPGIDLPGWRRRPVRRRRVDLERLGAVLRDPGRRLRELLEDPGEVVVALWPVLIDVLGAWDLGASTAETDPAAPDAALLAQILVVDILTAREPPQFNRVAVSVENDPVRGLTATVVISPGIDVHVTNGPWHASVAVPGPQRLMLSAAGAERTDAPGGADPQVTVSAGYTSATTPAVRLGSTEGLHVTIGSIDAAVSVTVGPNAVDVVGSAALQGITLGIAATDGFLATVLGDDPVTVSGDLVVAVSARTGISFAGSRSPRAILVTRRTIGVVDLVDVALELLPGGEPGLELTGGVTAHLGPLTISVERIGLQGRLGASGAEPGTLLPARVGVRPPAGAAVSIDAAAVTGGGYLFFDPENEQYAGALHLQFEKLTLNAFGLLTTRMPDGSRGFSLLVIVQATGFPPIQLGFGFTLTGIGGLLGINRTVAVDVLRAGVRDRTLDSILFSQGDPTPRAPQIISTLRTVFPPAADQYVFGPMAQLSWGTPVPLVTIEIALILELPAPLRLIVLGRVRAALPDAEHPIVSINLDVVGVIDFDRRELSVDASLYDSTVGPFALSGDMAARASWGDNPDFAMALGGFHPAFHPPEGFPALRRMALALSTGSNPRLRMETYLALTSNTVQMGARLELYVEVSGFSLQGTLGFDTLIQFTPFRVLAEIYARLTLKRGGATLLALDIHVHLTGPAPWVLWGEASFTIFFFSVSISFRATFGRAEAVPAIERQDVWPVLRDALAAPGNWSAQLPSDSGRLVVFSGPSDSTEPLAHPLGTLTVSQNLVPLERQLGLFGSVPPKDFDRFAVVAATGLATDGPTTQHFAPAQFRRMSDAEKLASPSFERMVSGLRLAPTQTVAVGHVQEVPLDYEQSVILDVDQPASDRLSAGYVPDGATVAAMAEHGPAGTAALREQGREAFAPAEPGPPVAEPVYLLVSRDDLTPEPLEEPDGTYTSAAERLRRRPDRDRLQIVRAEELVLA